MIGRGGEARLGGALRHPHTYVVSASLVVTVVLGRHEEWLTHPASQWLPVAYAASFCFLLRPRHWPVALASLAAALWLASQINDTKISLTRLPVTALDLRILVANPRGLVDALQLPAWMVAGAALGLTLAGVGLWRLCAAGIAHATGRQGPGRPGPSLRTSAVAWALLGVFSWHFVDHYVAAVHRYVGDTDAVWEPDGVAALSHRLGILGFLIYSYELERMSTGDYFRRAVDAAPPSPAAIRAAAASLVVPAPTSGHRKPNVVVVLAESTFNVNDAFALRTPVHNGLFERNHFTQALGPLYVNGVGGGTWLAEFESLVGVDERLFGYAGFYTHSSLSPFVKRTFAHYLKARGYATSAYYAVEGTFYNARNAYRQYGFDRFLDGPQLGLKEHWRVTDEEMAAAVIARSDETSTEPFFKYVTLIENHAPHECRSAGPADALIAFAGPASAAENCILGEFARRARSTNRAFEALVTYLRDIERDTGRPFVLLIFGDHQPHTFTSTGGSLSPYDFSPYRRDVDVRHTFFHLVSSLPGVVTCCSAVAPPVTLMPTLLSAYVASTVDDLYLGVNLYQYAKCGSDFMSESQDGFYSPVSAADGVQRRRCAVYDEVLAAYRESGTF